MKISLDVDLTPEELRRLFGLPDLTPIQNLVIDRITTQVEKGLEAGLMTTITRSLITGGLQSWDAYQKMLSTLLSARPGSEARSAEDSSPRT